MKISAGSKRRDLEDLSHYDLNFESVSNFTYLGLSINQENKISSIMQMRLMLWNRAYFDSLKLFRSRLLPRKQRLNCIRLFITEADAKNYIFFEERVYDATFIES